jgi:ketosteroid isomerase-like protein
MMQRMMGMHQKMMADPAMRERMMADPEMRQMMEGMKERMKEGGMMPGGMDHDRMEGMDHSRMEGMEHGQMSGMQHGPMSADAARAAEAASRTADRFYTALTAGDRAVVESLLLPDAVVLEGGKAEARAEYLGHHFGSDIAFLASVEREPLTRKTDVAGDAAWVASTSRVSGAYEGRTLDLDSAELLVLRHDAAAPDGWRIAAVHWSSASRE